METLSLSDYAIYCTGEQTRKALELGAPIKPKIELFTPYLKETPYTNISIDGEDAILIIPTTEQMIGWLEDQGIHINRIYNFDLLTCTILYKNYAICDDIYDIPKKATLSAIDVALEYLTDNNLKK